MHILTEEGLEQVKQSKYQAPHVTFMERRLNPWWERAVQMLPMWLAPNLISLLGFIPLPVLYIAIWYQNPSFDEAAPRWLSFAAAVVVFWHQTLDNMDGKQARRTGSSSPMGCIIDHYCDILGFLPQIAVWAMLCAPGGYIQLVHVVGQISYFAAVLAMYHTGVCPVGAGDFGIVEMQTITYFGLLLSGCVGPDTWQMWMTTEVSLPKLPAWASVKLGTLIIFASTLGWIGCIAEMLSDVVAHVRSKEKSVLLILEDMLSLIFMCVASFLWEPALAESNPWAVSLLSGLSMAQITLQMLLCSIAKMKYVKLQPCVLPFVVLVIGSWCMPLQWTKNAVLVYTAALGGWLLLWLLSVIHQLKDKLEIYVFSLARKNTQSSD